MSRSLASYAFDRQGEAQDLNFMLGTAVNPSGAQPAVAMQPGGPVAVPPTAPAVTSAGPSPKVQHILANTRGEASGYDTLFNNAERPGGPFEGVKVSEMTLGGVKDFTDPNGPYGQYVASHNDGTVATPTGRFQVVGKTLRDAQKGLGLSDDTPFTPDVQNQIAEWVYDNQGPQAWEAWSGRKSQLGGKSGGAAPTGATGRGHEAYTEMFPEEEPEKGKLDWASGLQSLGVGLGQLSHGQPVDVSSVNDRQERRMLRNRADAKDRRERRTAANYAASQGNVAAAEAIMSGGMDLGEFLTVEQNDWVRDRTEQQDAESDRGKEALFNYGMNELGLDSSGAGAFALNPSAYAAGEQLKSAKDAVQRALDQDEATADALLSVWTKPEFANDPDIQGAVEALQSGGGQAVAGIEKMFDISETLKEAKRADRRLEQTDTTISQADRRLTNDQTNADRSAGQTDRSLDQGEARINLDMGDSLFRSDMARRAADQADRGLDLNEAGLNYNQGSRMRELDQADRSLGLQERGLRNSEFSTQSSVANAQENTKIARDTLEFNIKDTEQTRQDKLDALERADVSRAKLVETLRTMPGAEDTAALLENDPTLDPKTAIDITTADDTTDVLNYNAYMKDEKGRGNSDPMSFNQFTNMQKQAAAGENSFTKKLGETTATQVTDWAGSRANTASSVAKLTEVVRLLENGDVQTGSIVGQVSKYAPSLVPLLQGKDTMQAKDLLESVVQQTLTETIGAQFAKTEGEQLIARAYNPLLSPQENAKRVGILLDTMNEIITMKDAMLTEAQKPGATGQSVLGSVSTSTADMAARLNQRFDVMDAAAPTGATTPTPASIDEMTDAEVEAEYDRLHPSGGN